MSAPLLELQGVQKYFPVSTGTLLRRKLGWVKAVDGVDFAVWPGETLGLIGESGCGKTTTSKLILLQETPTGGAIRFGGEDISKLQSQELMRYRREVQVVFQDPYSSLSPRMRVGDIVAEPLEIHTNLSREALHERVAEVLELVGLQPEVARLFPHEFSGGQRQRIAIARALATHTRLIVLDEPVSALDVSIRAQIMNQLEHLQQTLGVSYLFIGHDLATVAHISHRMGERWKGILIQHACDFLPVSPAEEKGGSRQIRIPPGTLAEVDEQGHLLLRHPARQLVKVGGCERQRAGIGEILRILRHRQRTPLMISPEPFAPCAAWPRAHPRPPKGCDAIVLPRAREGYR